MAEETEVQEGEAAEAPDATGEPQGEPQGEPKTIGDAGSMDNAVYDIIVDVTAVLGTSEMQVSQILKLGRGAVVELDRLVGEAVDLKAENQLVARGEVVVIDDRLGVTITEIIKGR